MKKDENLVKVPSGTITVGLDERTVQQYKEMFPDQEITTSVTVEIHGHKILWRGSIELVIEYNSMLEGLMLRRIRLEQIWRQDGSLVFYGYCFVRGAERTFYVKKISRIQIDGIEINIRDFLDSLGIEYRGGYKIDKSKFKNGTICFTGTFHKKRSEIEKQTEDRGFNATHAVTSKTDYLVIGEELNKSGKPTYSLDKIQTATSLKIPIITEEELESLLAD